MLSNENLDYGSTGSKRKVVKKIKLHEFPFNNESTNTRNRNNNNNKSHKNKKSQNVSPKSKDRTNDNVLKNLIFCELNKKVNEQ